jgi:hypothetical protein
VYFGNNKVEIEDVHEPTVIDGHVKVKVSRNGICGTDLHEYYDGPIFISPTAPHPLTGKAMPVILGHEFSGTITQIGSGVTTLHEGDRVTIEPIYRCGQCRPCRSGHYNLCNVIGFHGLMAVLRVPGRIGCTSRWGCAGRPRCHCCSRCTGASRTDWISRPVPDSTIWRTNTSSWWCNRNNRAATTVCTAGIGSGRLTSSGRRANRPSSPELFGGSVRRPRSGDALADRR